MSIVLTENGERLYPHEIHISEENNMLVFCVVDEDGTNYTVSKPLKPEDLIFVKM